MPPRSARDIEDTQDIRDWILEHDAKQSVEDRWLAEWKQGTDHGIAKLSAEISGIKEELGKFEMNMAEQFRKTDNAISKLQTKVAVICGAAGGLGAVIGALGGNLATEKIVALQPVNTLRLITFFFGA